MGSEQQYVLDANFFIEAYRGYYAFDLCPGFWESLDYYGAQDTLVSVDRVRDELREGADLRQWKSNAPDGFFLSTNAEDVVAAYREAIRWAQQQDRFTEAAKAAFADKADAWVIATAKARDMILVTHEAAAPLSKKSVKIPDVCKALGVTCRKTFDILRSLHISYHWDRPTVAKV